MVSIRRLLQVPSPTSLSPTRFLPGLFAVLQEIIDQAICERQCIFKENKIFSLSSLLVGFGFAGLFICFYGVLLLFYHYEITNQKLFLFLRFPRRLSLSLILPP